LINLLSQTCAYAHQIAFTWCNHQRYSRRSASEHVRYGCPHMYDGIGRDETTGSRSRPSRRLNANGNTLDEKGKQYGSFNLTSVNSFCPVAGGVDTHLRWGILTRPQVGDFQVAIGANRREPRRIMASMVRLSGTEIDCRLLAIVLSRYLTRIEHRHIDTIRLSRIDIPPQFIREIPFIIFKECKGPFEW